MGKRVAICAVSQVKNDGDYWYLRFQNMLLPCLESIIEQTGVTFDLEQGIRDIIMTAKPGLIRRFFSTLWHLISAVRNLLANLVFLVLIVIVV
ncbi:MAG: hypothetical protein RRA35_08845, partial [Desulfomonilia bacterium]|nr:hypothetical protein [Desulfomonilia bacterium]